ncbi:10278_t:CDS:2 [Funneliformis geosporum]|uniref:10278_t:CDS:1 n=1 Tax=Funneliformis geosporum TaxID=1117311 RepID=A0A9W4WSX2_9GLOM|nr:10278_t:CDS:2 [Funneliformis geosporum]
MTGEQVRKVIPRKEHKQRELQLTGLKQILSANGKISCQSIRDIIKQLVKQLLIFGLLMQNPDIFAILDRVPCSAHSL